MSTKQIGITLTVAFAVLLSILAGMGWLGLNRMSQVNAEIQDSAREHWTKVELASRALQCSSMNNRITMQIFLMTKRDEINALLARRADNSATISAILRELGANAESESERELLAAVERARTPYTDSYKHNLHLLLDQHRPEDARNGMLTITLPLLEKYHAAWLKLVESQKTEMDRHLREMADEYVAARRLVLFLMALALLAGIGTGLFAVYKTMAEISSRELAESRVRRFNEELERKVNERTVALSRSNEMLTHEIATRKRTEEQLLLLSSAVEQSPVSVVITDPRGNIVYVNRKFVDCSGYRLEEVLGRNPRVLKSGHSSPETYKELWAAITQGREWRGEFQNRRKNGELYWESAVITPIANSEGIISHFLAVKEDISERKMLQTQLQQAQKLEAIGHLAAGIAHEINTPIQYVGDNVTFIKETWTSMASVLSALGKICAHGEDKAPSPSVLEELKGSFRSVDLEYLHNEIPRAIEQSLEGVQRVAKIVRAMKEFSHPDSCDKIAADLNKAIETTIMVARNEWKYVADVETRFDENLSPVVCYPGDVNQVVLNLIVNAAHAIKDKIRDGEKGLITVCTKARDDCAEIAITDSGTGVPEAIRSRVFDPFFTTKDVGKGTGQGLTLAHNVVVKKHGGKIWFETETGRGTTFFIQLPLDPPLAKALGTHDMVQ